MNNITLSPKEVADAKDFASVHERAIEKVALRAKSSLLDSLSYVRQGRGLSAYGAAASAVLGMPSDMVTADDIAAANASIAAISNYIHSPKFQSHDTYRGRGEIDFAAIRIVRLLFIDKERLEQKTKEGLENFFLNDDFMSIHVSENHFLMSVTPRYLAACHYAKNPPSNQKYKNELGEAIFLPYTAEGEKRVKYDAERNAEYDEEKPPITARELKEIDRKYLISYMQYRARRGWGEFNSIGYEVHNFNTLLALYECSPDEDIRKLASMLMETMLLTMMENTAKGGIYGGAHGRAGNSAVNGVDIGIYNLDWLYFGHGDFDAVDSRLSASSEPYIMLSSWRPDISLYRVYANKSYPFTAKERVQNHTPAPTPREFGSISKYTYNTEYYSMGCINHQDSYTEEDWYEEHQQTNMSFEFAKNPKAGIVVHHPNDNGSHCYWYGDQLCHCNHLFGYENVMTGIFHITKEQDERFNFVHARIAKNLYDEVIEDKENNRLFIKYGDAYVSLIFSHPYEWGGRNPESEIVIYDGEKTSDIRIAFALEAGDVKTNGSFEQFIASIKAKEFKFKADALQLIYGNMRYEIDVNPSDETEVTAENQYIDGVLQSEHYDCTYNSPFMKSIWDSGVIEIYYDGMVRVLDFMKITDKTYKNK